jgi:hypothetical protein
MLAWFDQQRAKGYDDARAHPEKCRCGRMVTRPEQCDGPPCPFDRQKRKGLPLPHDFDCERDGCRNLDGDDATEGGICVGCGRTLFPCNPGGPHAADATGEPV